MPTISDQKKVIESDSQDLSNFSNFGIKYTDSMPLSDIASIAQTDNNVNYQNLDNTYVTGNVVRVAQINLPVFIKDTNLSIAEEVSPPSPTNNLQSLASIIADHPGFKVPILVQVNRWLQLGLIALCALAILAYSLDVIISHDVMLRQEQARRLSEQNAELSARLLKSISFQGIQESVLGQGMGPANLHVADEVLIAKEVPPVKIEPIKPIKHHLPLLSGY